MARGARRNKGRQITIQLLALRVFALQVACELSANGHQQAAIALIEALAQSQQQSSNRALAVTQRDGDVFKRVDFSHRR